MTNGNDYAQPQQFTVDTFGRVYLYENYGSQNGLTKREEFAKTFMAAMLSNSNLYCNANYDKELKVFAEKAMIATDALIAELNKTTTNG